MRSSTAATVIMLGVLTGACDVPPPVGGPPPRTAHVTATGGHLEADLLTADGAVGQHATAEVDPTTAAVTACGRDRTCMERAAPRPQPISFTPSDPPPVIGPGGGGGGGVSPKEERCFDRYLFCMDVTCGDIPWPLHGIYWACVLGCSASYAACLGAP